MPELQPLHELPLAPCWPAACSPWPWNRTARQATAVWLHARIDARELYPQAGFRIVGERFLEAGIPHIGMERDLAQRTRP